MDIFFLNLGRVPRRRVLGFLHCVRCRLINHPVAARGFCLPPQSSPAHSRGCLRRPRRLSSSSFLTSSPSLTIMLLLTPSLSFAEKYGAAEWTLTWGACVRAAQERLVGPLPEYSFCEIPLAYRMFPQFCNLEIHRRLRSSWVLLETSSAHCQQLVFYRGFESKQNRADGKTCKSGHAKSKEGSVRKALVIRKVNSVTLFLSIYPPK